MDGFGIVQTHAKGRALTIHYDAVDVYPGDDPRELPAIKAAGIPWEPNTLVIICSPGLGYGIKSLNSNYFTQHMVLAIELCPQLAEVYLQQTNDGSLSDLNLDLCFAQGHENIGEYSLRLENHLQTYFRKTRRIIWLSLNGIRGKLTELYRPLLQYQESALQRFWRNRSTLLYHGRRWVRNLLSNLNHGYQPWSPSNITIDGTILVCAAGPSLDDHMDFIVAHRKDLFIISADTALLSLVHRGIKPDVVVVLEGQWYNLNDFILSNFPDGLHIWADTTSHAPTLRYLEQRGARIFLFGSNFAQGPDYGTFLQTQGISPIPALGSVGVAALHMALQFPGNTIAFTGLDFATKPGQTHAKDGPHYFSGLETWTRLGPHPWLGHVPLAPDPTLGSYAELTRQRIREHRAHHPHQILLDLRTKGLDLGLPRSKWTDISQKKSWSLGHGKDEKLKAPTKNKLQGLKEKLWITRAHLKQTLQNQGSSNTDYGPIMDFLRDHGFLFCDFPDQEWPPKNMEAMARIYLRLLEITEILEHQ